MDIFNSHRCLKRKSSISMEIIYAHLSKKKVYKIVVHLKSEKVRIGWDRVSVPHSSYHSAVLCTEIKVSITHHCFGYCCASQQIKAVSPTFSPHQQAGSWQDPGRKHSQESWPNWPKGYSIPDDVYSATNRKEEQCSLLHLSFRVMATCTEALLPRKWLYIAYRWEKKIRFCFHLILCMAFALDCLYLDPQGFFHLTFFPIVLLRRRVIEWLGGHLAST